MNSRFPMQSAAAPQGRDPADACTNWTWIRDVLAPIGLTVVVVEWTRADGRFPGPLMARDIGQKLAAGELGEFDSIKVGKVIRFFFHVAVERLAEALQTVESELQARDMLANAKIAHADAEAGLWRTFWPKAGPDTL
jgi:hypothetical protein